VVQADDSVSVANVEPAFWEYQGIDCFSGKDWGEGPIEPVSSDQQPILVVGSYSNFEWGTQLMELMESWDVDLCRLTSWKK
jgi:hypothetical protein